MDMKQVVGVAALAGAGYLVYRQYQSRFVPAVAGTGAPGPGGMVFRPTQADTSPGTQVPAQVPTSVIQGLFAEISLDKVYWYTTSDPQLQAQYHQDAMAARAKLRAMGVTIPPAFSNDPWSQ